MGGEDAACRKFRKYILVESIMRVATSFLLFLLFCIALFGQEPSAKPLIAPGGLIVIPPDIDYESVTNRSDITELLAVLPEVDPDLKNEVRFNPNIWAKEIRYHRDVWCLQFSFKPLRIVEVDIPNADGKFDQKQVWYLVYNVKNLGPSELDERKINSSLGSDVLTGDAKNLPVTQDKTLNDLPRSAALEVRRQSGIFSPQPGSSEAIRFVPQFILATDRLVLGTDPVTNPETGKTEWQTEAQAISYPDRIIPLALPVIMKREGMKVVPETTVSITNKEIASGQDLWGVAMWTDIDPRIHEFSIYVTGLTNAYQWLEKITEEGTYENKGVVGEGRVLKRRVLKLDWWRLGDQYSVNDSQIRFGQKNEKMPTTIFDLNGDFNRDGKVDPEERKRFEKILEAADINKDGWVSETEKAEYYRIHQTWLQIGFGYEWLFL